MNIKPLEWIYSNDVTEEWYTILAYEYQTEQCGNIYDGYRIIKISGSVFELDLCKAYMGIFFDLETAKIAAFKHWETIIRSSIDGN